jgi:hypothetical protein
MEGQLAILRSSEKKAPGWFVQYLVGSPVLETGHLIQPEAEAKSNDTEI